MNTLLIYSHPVQREVDTCNEIIDKLQNLINKRKKQKQSKEEKDSKLNAENKQEEEEFDPFTSDPFDFNMILKFEMLSVSVPKNRTEAIALRKTLIDKRV